MEQCTLVIIDLASGGTREPIPFPGKIWAPSPDNLVIFLKIFEKGKFFWHQLPPPKKWELYAD